MAGCDGWMDPSGGWGEGWCPIRRAVSVACHIYCHAGHADCSCSQSHDIGNPPVMPPVPLPGHGPPHVPHLRTWWTGRHGVLSYCWNWLWVKIIITTCICLYSVYIYRSYCGRLIPTRVCTFRCGFCLGLLLVAVVLSVTNWLWALSVWEVLLRAIYKPSYGSRTFIWPLWTGSGRLEICQLCYFLSSWAKWEYPFINHA